MLMTLLLSGYPNSRLANGFPWVPPSAPLFGLSEVTSSVKLKSPVGFGGWKKLLKKSLQVLIIKKFVRLSLKKQLYLPAVLAKKPILSVKRCIPSLIKAKQALP